LFIVSSAFFFNSGLLNLPFVLNCVLGLSFFGSSFDFEIKSLTTSSLFCPFLIGMWTPLTVIQSLMLLSLG